MRSVQYALLTAVVLAVLSVSFELYQLNAALRPLNRIPTTNTLGSSHPDETREQRIERVARQRIQQRDDDRAVDDKIRELMLVRQAGTTPSRQQTPPQARR